MSNYLIRMTNRGISTEVLRCPTLVVDNLAVTNAQYRVNIGVDITGA